MTHCPVIPVCVWWLMLQATDDMIDLEKLFHSVKEIERMAEDMAGDAEALPSSPSATHSGRSAHSGGGSSSTSDGSGQGGGGGGQLRGVTVGGHRLHQQSLGGSSGGGGAGGGQDWQAGLLQYSDGDSQGGGAPPPNAAAAEGQEAPAQVWGGAAGLGDECWCEGGFLTGAWLEEGITTPLHDLWSLRPRAAAACRLIASLTASRAAGRPVALPRCSTFRRTWLRSKRRK